MNIESTATASATITKTASASDTPSTTSSSSSKSSTDSTSFKDELSAIKSQDSSTQETQTQDSKTTQELDGKVDKTSTDNVEKNQQTAEEKNAQQIAKDKLTTENDQLNDKLGNIKITDPLKELNSKIQVLSDLKNASGSKTEGLLSSSQTDEKSDIGQSMKMNNQDITFFVNLVNNQQMEAQSAQQSINNNNNSANNNFTEIKSAATQSSVQVSQTLLDALSDTAKTGKSLRIDFGSDVAVIMKVDQKGVISANFIPGSAAVENYLKNNIDGLKQAFDNQDLPYNQLSYSNQQKNKQQDQEKKQQEKQDE